jgi:cytochrome P450
MTSRLPGVSYMPRMPFVGSLFHLLWARTDILLDAMRNLGDTFGLDLGGEHVLVVGHPADAMRVLNDRPDIYPDKGGATGFRRSSIPFLGDGLSTWNSMDDEWRRRRTGMTHLFRSRSPLPDTSRTLAGASVSRARETLESDVVSDLAVTLLGYRPERTDVDDVARRLHRLTGTFWSGKLSGPHPVLARRTREDLVVLKSIVRGWVDEALRRTELPLIRHVGGLTASQVRDEVLSQLLTAGTLATPIVWGLDLLARNPEAQTRLREALTPGSRDADYVVWTTREILRLCPATYWVQRRAALDDDLSGVPVVTGTRVIVYVPRVHRHPDYWIEADAFRPERFGDGADWLRAWMPFGRGARSCVARNYSFDVITRVLDQFLRDHRIESLGVATHLIPGFSLVARPTPTFAVRPFDAG